MDNHAKTVKRSKIPADVKYVVVDFMTYRIIMRLVKNKSILEPLDDEPVEIQDPRIYYHDFNRILVVDKAWCESVVDYMNKRCNRQEGYWTIEPGSGMICYQHLTESGCVGRKDVYSLIPVVRHHLFNLALDDVL